MNQPTSLHHLHLLSFYSSKCSCKPLFSTRAMGTISRASANARIAEYDKISAKPYLQLYHKIFTQKKKTC